MALWRDTATAHATRVTLLSRAVKEINLDRTMVVVVNAEIRTNAFCRRMAQTNSLISFLQDQFVQAVKLEDRD